MKVTDNSKLIINGLIGVVVLLVSGAIGMILQSVTDIKAEQIRSNALHEKRFSVLEKDVEANKTAIKIHHP